MPVPEFVFHEACDHHDFNYWLGCTDEDRKKADVEFLQEMIRLANYNEGYIQLAFIYFNAVRRFGGTCFHYADRERDETDLEKEILCKT